MLKAILFCAFLAYLSGVQAQTTTRRPNTTTRRPNTTTTTLRTTTPRPREPETWVNLEPGKPQRIIFRRISARRWDEISIDGSRARFDVLNARFDANGDFELELKKQDGNIVVLTEGEAFFGPNIDNLFGFADGFWADRNGVPIKSPRSNDETLIDIGTTRQASNPDTWLNAEKSFFRRINSSIWDEFDKNGKFASRFDVLASDLDRNGDLVLLLKKDDRNFVFLTEGTAYFGSVSEGRFFEFASGVWGDRNREPIKPLKKSGGVRSGQNSTHQACTVRVIDGKISYEEVGSVDLATDDEDSNRLEVWTNSKDKSNLFVHYRPKLWVQFKAGKPEKTFAEITRDTSRNLIGLKNNDSNAGNHSFVGLDSSRAYRGPSEMGLKEYATGSFSYLAIPN